MVLVSLLSVLSPPISVQADPTCDQETTKFVMQVAGTNLYYGNRDTVYSYNHQPICSGKVNAHSTFLRATDDYHNYVEVGVRQNDYDGTGYAHIWTEWRVWPELPVLDYWDGLFGRATTGRWYSFMITHVIYGEYGLYWAGENNPDLANWHFITTTDNLGRAYGEVESEEARFGTANADHHAQELEKQNTQDGGWSAWSNLQCDTKQNFITDWKAVKYSNQRWKNEHVSSGLC